MSRAPGKTSAAALARKLSAAVASEVARTLEKHCRAGGALFAAAQAITAAPPSPAPGSLEWSATLLAGERVDWATAEKACAALGDGWRLPTLAELESIRDITRVNPSIDVARFPDTKSTWYWTGTPHAWSPADYAWIVSFSFGLALNSHRSNNSACVRAVRAVVPGQCL